MLLAAAVGHPVFVRAHGIGLREMDPGAARALEFLYADGEPMAFVRGQATAPGVGGGVHQRAHADARGRFAFFPPPAFSCAPAGRSAGVHVLGRAEEKAYFDLDYYSQHR